MITQYARVFSDPASLVDFASVTAFAGRARARLQQGHPPSPRTGLVRLLDLHFHATGSAGGRSACSAGEASSRSGGSVN
jgi:hypothetical protein